MSEEAEVLDRGDALPEEEITEDTKNDEEVSQTAAEGPDDEATSEGEKQGTTIDSLQQQLELLQQQNQYLLYMQQQAQQEKQAVDKAAEPDLDAKLAELEDAYTDALMEGETEEAKQLYRDIRKIERDILQKEFSVSKEEITNVSERTVQKRELDTVVSDLEKSYSQLNPRSKKYDQNLVTAINGVFGSFLEQGTHSNPIEAMNAAVQMFESKLDVKRAGQSQPKQTLRSKLDTQKQQPASRPGKTSSTAPSVGDVTVSDLSDDKLFSLSNDQLAILRGDIVQQ